MNLFFRLFLLSSLFLVSVFANEPTNKVTLQLKWFSSFQFAGYYMALEKGFYKEAGLDVRILERNAQKNNIMQVVNGEATYGVADSALLLYRADGKPVKVMASIFQHSPLIFIAHKDSKIFSPYEFKGKRISYESGLDDSPLLAMMNDAGIKRSDYALVPHDFTAQAFIDGKVDMMSAYLSDQPFLMQEKNIPITIINPLNYGIDFYGDNLFATDKELASNPERAKRFLQASIRGWHYALEHEDETIAVLRSKYGAKSSVVHLKHEAEITRNMMVPTLVDIGYTNKERFYRIGEIYRTLGKVNQSDMDRALKDFIWNPNEKQKVDVRYLYVALALLLLIITFTFLLAITKRKLQSMVARKTKALVEQQSMTDKYVIMISIDLKNHITDASTAFCDLFGYTKLELMGKKIETVYNLDTASLHQEIMGQLDEHKKWSGEIRNADKQKNIYWLFANIEAIFDEIGMVKGYRAIQQNITDKKFAQQLSITDTLTELYNRSYLNTKLHAEVNLFHRYNTPMGIIMVDIDYFKDVNDTYGHLVGDSVLIEFAEILRVNVRITDIVGRWGGEEFVIICPFNTLHQVAELAEKLRVLVESYTFNTVGKKTASFGVGTIHKSEDEMELIRRIDDALYEAKRLGRNRVVKA